MLKTRRSPSAKSDFYCFILFTFFSLKYITIKEHKNSTIMIAIILAVAITFRQVHLLFLGI
jgi:hypothetical protein